MWPSASSILYVRMLSRLRGVRIVPANQNFVCWNLLNDKKNPLGRIFQAQK